MTGVERTGVIAVGAVLVFGLAATLFAPADNLVMGGYATTLLGRTSGQRTNALLAARALNGAVIEPGRELSFNRTVGSWTPDRGYTLAPVSYSGEMVVDWGGGVCQTSTTLYNAALLAGLRVAERHRHTWAPKYCPPGRDAAVAQNHIDLRLVNPYPFPVRVRAHAEGDTLHCEVLGRTEGPMARVETATEAAVPPIEIRQSTNRLKAGYRRVVNRGRPGVRIGVWRIRTSGPNANRRELISRDSYPAMNRVTLIGTRVDGGSTQ